MNRCRFAHLPGHQCRRRDGRLISPDEEAVCTAHARAQVDDEIALAAEVDAILAAEWETEAA